MSSRLMVMWGAVLARLMLPEAQCSRGSCIQEKYCSPLLMSTKEKISALSALVDMGRYSISAHVDIWSSAAWDHVDRETVMSMFKQGALLNLLLLPREAQLSLYCCCCQEEQGFRTCTVHP